LSYRRPPRRRPTPEFPAPLARYAAGPRLAPAAAGAQHGLRNSIRREIAMPGIETILIWLLVGAVAGWLAGVIVKGAGFGLVGNIIVGIIGAVVAGWLLPRIGVHIAVGNAILSAIIYAAIGGVVVLVVLSLVRRAA